MLPDVGVEIHDEVIDWLYELDDAEWSRAAVVIDRLADVAQQARMPL